MVGDPFDGLYSDGGEVSSKTGVGPLSWVASVIPQGETQTFPTFPWTAPGPASIIHHHWNQLDPGASSLFLPPHACSKALFCKQVGPMGIAIRKQRQEPRRQKRSTTFHHPSGSVPHCSIYLSQAGHVLTLIHDVKKALNKFTIVERCQSAECRDRERESGQNG